MLARLRPFDAAMGKYAGFRWWGVDGFDQGESCCIVRIEDGGFSLGWMLLFSCLVGGDCWDGKYPLVYVVHSIL